MIEILKVVEKCKIKGPRKAAFDKKLPGWLGFAKCLKLAPGEDGNASAWNGLGNFLHPLLVLEFQVVWQCQFSRHDSPGRLVLTGMTP